MITKTLPYALVVALLLTLTACGKREPLINIESTHMSPSAEATLDDVTDAILDAGRIKGWEMTVVEPGEIVGELFVSNKHTAIVQIDYTVNQFSILYDSSVNLNYKDSGAVVYIHPNYNIWVRLLKQEIQEQARHV